MKDSYGRNIDYMRISITDRCNLRCRYCMPADIETLEMDRLLTYEEIRTIAETGVRLGITHYRLTGGEPLIRRECVQLVEMLKKIPGVDTVGMTTNGVLLGKYAKALKSAGLDEVNVSLDTVDAQEFEQLTGRAELENVKRGIDVALEAKLPIKLNVVNLGKVDGRLILAYSEQKEIVVRFIEMMPIGYGKQYTGVSNQRLFKMLEEEYGKAKPCVEHMGYGPAVYYRFPGLKQQVGMIDAVNHKFCNTCNRVRLTSEGYLKLCLCYDEGVDLRGVLRSEKRALLLERIMKDAIFKKPVEHCFKKENEITEKRAMISIGG